MLPSTSPREAFLACPPFPSWNLLSFTVKATFFPMLLLRSSLSRQGAALAHLDSIPPYDLVLWIDISVPFPFDNGGSGAFANCSLCGTEATLSFSACTVCSSFSTEAGAIKQALCWSQQHQQVCHFSSLLLLSDSRSVLIIMSSPPSFLLPQSFWQELSSLSSCSIRLQWVPGHLFCPENGATDELARWGALLASSAIPCRLFPLISCIHSSFFSDWRHTVSSKFFDTQVPWISTEELVLPYHACCVLFCLCFNSLLLSFYLLDWQNQKSFLQHLQTLVPGHHSCRFALSSYGLLVPLAFWRFSVSLRPLVQALESFAVSSAPWSSAMPPSLGRDRVSTTLNENRINKRPICPLPCVMWIVINLKFCLNIL